MMKKNSEYYLGLKDGLPIGLGYLSISFGFGITAVSYGIKELYAILISMTNLTSAGQMAGISIIAACGTLLEMALTQFIINIRYSLMGIALSQKLSKEFNTYHRLMGSCFITDEIFAVAMLKKHLVTPTYLYGLATLPYIGWATGTVCGAFAGHILPVSVTSALGIAIYGMFIAIVVPPAKKDGGVLLAVVISVLMCLILKYAPLVKDIITPGFSIIICAVVASLIAAIIKPIKEGYDE